MSRNTLFNDFFNNEKAGGIILICCTIVSLIFSNAFLGLNYLSIWNYPISGHPLVHWINDGLMTIFFLLIGLELKRELLIGELSSIKKATLPIVAATGGMIIPATIFLFINFKLPTQPGAGIPMATDIAFAIGILSLLGNRVPLALKVLLTAIAVIDDLGAIIVIAIFYTKTIGFTELFISLLIFGMLLIFNKLNIKLLFPYLFGGLAMWYIMMQSGIHPTISGVLLAFTIPFTNGSKDALSYPLEHLLHKPVNYIILPLFALANTSILFSTDWYSGLGERLSIGILCGLVFGKPIGIFIFSFLSVIIGFCVKPKNLSWNQIFGIGILGGIGFTMSIFITLLAFDSPSYINQSKIAILISSLFAGIIGYVWLWFSLKNDNVQI